MTLAVNFKKKAKKPTHAVANTLNNSGPAQNHFKSGNKQTQREKKEELWKIITCKEYDQNNLIFQLLKSA